MDPKLQTNIANSWKMWSVRFTTLFSLGVAALGSWFLSLPMDCKPLLAAVPPQACGISQLSIIGDFGIVGPAAAVIAGAIVWALRVWPQANITPTVAVAKSADSPVSPPSGPSGT